jgi:O-acetyl-ADP-ribose deacetylase (regulator of RNase III)
MTVAGSQNGTSRSVNGVRFETVLGDITEQRVDAIVNAANSSLMGGGGVDGAIHRAGGPDILAACRVLRETRLPDGLPTGDAVATTAGRLPAGHVIHTVGPVWSRREDRTPLLRSAYSRSLEVAGEVGAASIAFPAISAGVYGWPMDDAARVAVATCFEGARDVAGLELVRFVLFSPDALAAFDRELASAAV